MSRKAWLIRLWPHGHIGISIVIGIIPTEIRIVTLRRLWKVVTVMSGLLL